MQRFKSHRGDDIDKHIHLSTIKLTIFGTYQYAVHANKLLM